MAKHKIDKPDLPSLGPLAILSDKERGILQFYGDFADFKAHQTIIRQDSDQDSLFFVIEGRLHAVRGEEDNWLVLGEINTGEWFGEIAMLDPQQQSASASVISYEDSRVWSISREQLEAYLNDYPVEGCGLLISLASTLSRRARDLLARLRKVNLAENIFSSDA